MKPLKIESSFWDRLAIFVLSLFFGGVATYWLEDVLDISSGWIKLLAVFVAIWAWARVVGKFK